MFETIQTVSKGRMFEPPSPFCCNVEFNHPKVCVITGQNISGKSLLRGVLHSYYKKQNLFFMHFSQEGRSAGGIGSCMVYGSDQDESTGYNSLNLILKVFKRKEKNPFVIFFDEPEIGCSEELQLALGNRIFRDWDIENLQALYIVTHSRHIARALLPLNPTHWRLSDDGMTLQQWTERPVVAVESLEDLREMGLQRWKIVNKMIK